MTRKKGFTIVELIIVIAVIGVLAAVLIPVFSNVIDKANEKSALADARNALTNYVADMTGNKKMPKPLPSTVFYVQKANKMYVFAYSQSLSKLLTYPESFKYDKSKSFEENVAVVEQSLVGNSAIVRPTDTVAWETLLDQFGSSNLAVRAGDANVVMFGEPQTT